MTERNYRGWLWSLALLGLLLDQGTKYAVFNWLYHNGQRSADDRVEGVRPLIPEAFDLRAEFIPQPIHPEHPLASLHALNGGQFPYVNKGALFGTRMWLSAEASNSVFAAISLAAVIAILWWSVRGSLTHDGLLCTALGLILGGTIGNLYDRVVFGGVRDFLHWHYAFDWPVFNVADCCLVGGAFLLLAQAFLVKHEQPVVEVVSNQAVETSV